MEQFGAHKLCGQMMGLGSWFSMLPRFERENRNWDAFRPELIKSFEDTADTLESLGCVVSAKSIRLHASNFRSRSPNEVVGVVESMMVTITSELDSHLFFWVPPHRAAFYGKTGQEILGDQCSNSFHKSDIANEAVQAAKCFAFGQYTACAFHLMRITEAGVTALGKAIGYTWPSSPNWGAMFSYFDSQSKPKSTHRIGVWVNNGDFLDEVGGHLRAVKNAWRNQTMHLESTYDESQAKHLLAVVPSFMRQLASKIDEDGNWI